MTKYRRTYRFNEQWKHIFPLSDLMNQVKLRHADLVIRRPITVVNQEILGIRALDRVDVDI